MNTDQPEVASWIIDRLGGTSATAALCEIKPASVSEWRKNGIPQARLLYLRLLRPEAFEPPNKMAAMAYSSSGDPE